MKLKKKIRKKIELLETEIKKLNKLKVDKNNEPSQFAKYTT